RRVLYPGAIVAACYITFLLATIWTRWLMPRAHWNITLGIAATAVILLPWLATHRAEQFRRWCWPLLVMLTTILVGADGILAAPIRLTCPPKESLDSVLVHGLVRDPKWPVYVVVRSQRLQQSYVRRVLSADRDGSWSSRVVLHGKPGEQFEI